MNLSLSLSGRSLRKEFKELLSLLLFLVVTALLFRSWEFALIVTACLGFHELGHAAALTWFRVEYRIYFGVVGAWTWSRLEDRARLSQLANVYVHLAGPLFSLGLAFIALGLHYVWQPSSQHLMILANFSAQIGLLNLLPLGSLTDGGKVLRRTAVSVKSGRGNSLLMALMTAAVLSPLIYSILRLSWLGIFNLTPDLLGFTLIGVWMGASLLLEMRRGEVNSLVGGRLMTPRQVIFIMLLLWDMLAAMQLVVMTTPFWLAPQYVLGSLENAQALLNLVGLLLAGLLS